MMMIPVQVPLRNFPAQPANNRISKNAIIDDGKSIFLLLIGFM